MNLRYTRRALRDIAQARAYIAQETTAGADRAVRRIELAIADLALFPSQGRMGRVSSTRELVVPRTPFVVAYRQREQTIEVLAIIHGARAWPEEF